MNLHIQGTIRLTSLLSKRPLSDEEVSILDTLVFLQRYEYYLSYTTRSGIKKK